MVDPAPETNLEAQHADPVCKNCGLVLAWHGVGQAWIHADTRHWWCFPERQGYQQPRATPARIDGLDGAGKLES